MNDLTKLDDVLSAIVVKRPKPSVRRSKHLCADAGYPSKAAAGIIESHGYIAHVVDRRQEKERKRRDPTKKARRWVVEVCHSWFNRFRKLLVRYEKLERSFVALNHIAAAIIACKGAGELIDYFMDKLLATQHSTSCVAPRLPGPRDGIDPLCARAGATHSTGFLRRAP